MNKQALYRALLKVMPPKRLTLEGSGLHEADERVLCDILRRHRCIGAEVRLFDIVGKGAAYRYGVAEGTAFRVASISKMLTAACALNLAQQGMVQLHAPADDYLPYKLRHPARSEMPITLHMLMTHTGGIRDGADYGRAMQHPMPAEKVLAGDSWHTHLPGEQWSYSNLGAGLVGCVLEAALEQPFEGIMQRYLFAPLGISASFYPQFVRGPLADARRVLPPARKPGFNAAERKRRSTEGADEPRPKEHYLMAQGSCCMTAKDLAVAVQALTVPGYLSEQSLHTMRNAATAFGARSRHLRQGPGLFRLEDSRLAPLPLFGHQGNAYGAVHAAFFEPSCGRGLVFLSVGVSEARREFLADVVEDLLQFGFAESLWQRIQ